MFEKPVTARNLMADRSETLRDLAPGELELIEGGYVTSVGSLFERYQLPTIFEPKNGPTVPTVSMPQVYPR